MGVAGEGAAGEGAGDAAAGLAMFRVGMMGAFLLRLGPGEPETDGRAGVGGLVLQQNICSLKILIKPYDHGVADHPQQLWQYFSGKSLPKIAKL